VFSQKMLENLVNDLMDNAKNGEHKFSLQESYFDLEKLINQSF
jgi:hypothetical protein